VVCAAAGERHKMVYVFGGRAAVLATVMVACKDLRSESSPWAAALAVDLVGGAAVAIRGEGAAG